MTLASAVIQVKDVAVDTSSKQKYSSVLRKAGSWEWLQQLLTTLRRWDGKERHNLVPFSARW